MRLPKLGVWLLDRPLRSKLNLIFTVPMIVIVGVTLALVSRAQVTGLESRKLDSTRSILQALSQDFQRIELLPDHSHRSDMAVRLRSFRDIEYLVLFDRQGKRVFYYGRPDLSMFSSPPPPIGTVVFARGRLQLHQSLMGPGAGGSVYIQRDAADIRDKARHDGLLILLFGLILTAVAIGSSVVARALVVRPIESLSELSHRVASRQEYHLRAAMSQGDEIGLLAHGIDHLLHETQRHLVELDQAVEEREALIATLEAKNAELERFTYTVSHDMTSPLVTIRGFAGMLEQDLARGSEERVKKDLARIKDAAQHMADLLKDLLELSRIGRVINPPRKVAVAELVQEALDLLQGAIHRSGVVIHVDADLPEVRVDAPRIVEVFQNLIENALKFMGDQPEPRIEIGGWVEAGQAVCYVKDNGQGIEPTYQEKIFGLFERLDPQIEGTGIGLALIRRIVEVHGGKLWVESEGLGTGSTFFLSIPEAGASAAD